MRVEEVEVWGQPGSLLSGTVPMRGVTVLLGANSTGKTTLLEIIELELESHPYHSSDRSGFRHHGDTFADLSWSYDPTDENDRQLLSMCATTAREAPGQLADMLGGQSEDGQLYEAIAKAARLATLEKRSSVESTWEELVAAAASRRVVLTPDGADYLLSPDFDEMRA